MMGAMSRRKGVAWERQVCRMLFGQGFVAKRALGQYQESSGRDIDTDAPVCIQCKCGERINVRRAYEEADGALLGDEIPMVAASWTDGPKVAVVPLWWAIEQLKEKP